jgi:hypothetical protein
MANEVRELKTKSGFAACRRCEKCGARINNITLDTSEECILKCRQCGKEYNFRLNLGTSRSIVEAFPIFCF